MKTKHFDSKEFECKCGCGSYVQNTALLILLEDVRNKFNKPVTINSSTRCEKHNKNVGGSEYSMHLSGHAADIVVKDTHPDSVYRYLNSCGYADLIGLGSYTSFTHVDTRGKRARW
jgi:uncharacterized protein YcbK (DUF882 family)